MKNKNIKNLSVIVTGAAGFIGSHLCSALIKNGYLPIGIDLPAANWWRHDELNLDIPRESFDLTDRKSIHSLFEKYKSVDCVFHLASHVDVSRSEDLIDIMILQHIVATAYLLRASHGKVRRIILAGTCEEYGNGSAPFSEYDRERAVSPYSWSKICTSHLGQLYSNMLNADVVIVRPFLTYGPLQTSNMLIPSAIRAAINNESIDMTLGEQTRDFNYITDIVDGFIALAESTISKGEIINIGSGIEVPISEVVSLIYLMCNATCRPNFGIVPYRTGESMRFYSNSANAFGSLGWVPKISLQDGLEKTVSWYLSKSNK